MGFSEALTPEQDFLVQFFLRSALQKVSLVFFSALEGYFLFVGPIYAVAFYSVFHSESVVRKG